MLRTVPEASFFARLPSAPVSMASASVWERSEKNSAMRSCDASGGPSWAPRGRSRTSVSRLAMSGYFASIGSSVARSAMSSGSGRVFLPVIFAAMVFFATWAARRTLLGEGIDTPPKRTIFDATYFPLVESMECIVLP